MPEKTLARIAAERDEARSRLDKLERRLADTLCRQVANEVMLRAGVTRGTKVVEGALLARLQAVGLDTDKPSVAVLDEFGHVTNMAPSQLIDQLKSDPDFGLVFVETKKRGSGDPPARPNPFKPGPNFNVTAQAKLIKADPKLADRLKAEAAAQA
jgi:hypothetical protein